MQNDSLVKCIGNEDCHKNSLGAFGFAQQEVRYIFPKAEK